MLFLINNELLQSFFSQLQPTIHQHYLLLHLYQQYFKIKHTLILMNTFHESFFHHQFLISEYLQNISLNVVTLFMDLWFLTIFPIIHHLIRNKILENWYVYPLNKNLILSNKLPMKCGILSIYQAFFYFLYIQ